MNCDLCAKLSDESFIKSYAEKNPGVKFMCQCFGCGILFPLGKECEHCKEEHRHIEVPEDTK